MAKAPLTLMRRRGPLQLCLVGILRLITSAIRPAIKQITMMVFCSIELAALMFACNHIKNYIGCHGWRNANSLLVLRDHIDIPHWLNKAGAFLVMAHRATNRSLYEKSYRKDKYLKIQSITWRCLCPTTILKPRSNL